MSQDFDAQIAALEQRLETLKGDMANAREQWLDQLAPRIASYWEMKAEKTVTAEADHSNELGLDEIKEIKSEIKAMMQEARAVAEDRLVNDRPEIWPDLAPQTDPHDRKFGASGPGSGFRLHDFYFEDRFKREGSVEGPDALSGPVNQLAGEVNTLLRRHGFDVLSSSRSIPSWTWDEQLAPTVNAYADLHDQYMSALVDLKSVRAEKSRSEAKGLWEEA
jgi:hypothetical protein